MQLPLSLWLDILASWVLHLRSTLSESIGLESGQRLYFVKLSLSSLSSYSRSEELSTLPPKHILGCLSRHIVSLYDESNVTVTLGNSLPPVEVFLREPGEWNDTGALTLLVLQHVAMVLNKLCQALKRVNCTQREVFCRRNAPFTTLLFLVIFSLIFRVFQSNRKWDLDRSWVLVTRPELPCQNTPWTISSVLPQVELTH